MKGGGGGRESGRELEEEREGGPRCDGEREGESLRGRERGAQM